MASRCFGWRRALATALLLFASLVVSAQDTYPSRSIRLVVPYPPGALTDLLARAIAERLSAGLKEPVVVDNKPGAGTLVGAEFVANSRRTDIRCSWPRRRRSA